MATKYVRLDRPKAMPRTLITLKLPDAFLEMWNELMYLTGGSRVDYSLRCVTADVNGICGDAINRGVITCEEFDRLCDDARNGDNTGYYNGFRRVLKVIRERSPGFASRPSPFDPQKSCVPQNHE